MGRIEKSLRNLFDRSRPYFEDGRRLRPLKPIFEASETFSCFRRCRLKKNPLSGTAST